MLQTERQKEIIPSEKIFQAKKCNILNNNNNNNNDNNNNNNNNNNNRGFT